MYNDIYLHPRVNERLIELEDELDLPIRVISWTNSRFTDGFGWRNMPRRDLTEDEAAETGITVWCGGPRQQGYDYREYSFSEFHVYEALTYPTEPDSPVVYEDQTIGEVGERWVGLCFMPSDSFEIPESFADVIVEACIASVNPEFLATWAERAEQRNREAFENFVRRSYDSRFQGYRDAITAQQLNIINWQDAIVTAMRQVQRQNEMLDALILVRENDAGDQFMRQWEQLGEHPRIENIRFASSAIEITTTDDLRLHHPVSGESRWLGAFKITLSLDNMQMRLRNLNTVRGGRDHPHIVEGAACFGGHSPAFTELLSKGEIYTLFELLVQYLETLNLADEYGRYGAYWFDAPDERPLVTDEAELVTA